MDPNACWADALTALAQGDRREYGERLCDLKDWRRKGGFAPNIGQRDAAEFDRFLSLLLAATI